jgi:GDSL-like Lipase/Acylhydrolase family
MPINSRKRLLFAVAAMALATVGTFGGLLAIDIRLHSKFERSAGVNVWGYRGPVAARKATGELRVAVLGGSTAYGYGVTADEAMPARLEQKLRARRVAASQPPVSVVNLAYNNEGVYSYAFTLRDYAYLDYDIVLMYQGYNDLGGKPNLQVYRHQSPVFRMTGYLPIFPVVFREKAGAMLHGGDVGALYREARGETEENKTVFRPGLANRATAGALNAAAAIAESLSNQMERISSAPALQNHEKAPEGCAGQWGQFCQSVFDAVDLALSNGKRVMVLTQPYLTGISEARNRSQQDALRAGLSRRYAGNARLQYIDLGEAINLDDRSLCYDGMHLTADGNALIADKLLEPVLSMAASIR